MPLVRAQVPVVLRTMGILQFSEALNKQVSPPAHVLTPMHNAPMHPTCFLYVQPCVPGNRTLSDVA